MHTRTLAALAIPLLLAACGPGGASSDGDGTWVGTITTDGDVTTVVNESGSVWGGTATLVEEASIGVESGADEYMFGRIGAVYATDELIYVLDAQVPAVRVYDHDGTFVRTLGGEGQGPGEYTSPSLLTADNAGRVYLYDSRLGRINIYGPDGAVLDGWPFTTSRCCAWPMYTLTGEAAWAPVQEWNEDHSERRYGLQAVGPQGPYGEITWIPELEHQQATYKVEGDFEDTAPFSPWLLWNPAPDGRMLAGASDTYRFEVHDRDGSKLIVQRTWEPVPVPAEHKEWERRRTVSLRRRYNGADFTWDGAEIPDHKAAYTSLIPALSGETWVLRWGASIRLDDCTEDPIAEGYQAAYERPCWDNENIVDVFGADGRYLGEVDVPDGVDPFALTFSVDDDRVVAAVEDAEGVLKVKRYRLVRPGDAR